MLESHSWRLSPSTWWICPCVTAKLWCKTVIWFSGTDTKTLCLLRLSYNVERFSAIKLCGTVAMLMLRHLQRLLSFVFKQQPAARLREGFSDSHINLLPAKVFRENRLRDPTKTATQITIFTFCHYTPHGFISTRSAVDSQFWDSIAKEYTNLKLNLHSQIKNKLNCKYRTCLWLSLWYILALYCGLHWIVQGPESTTKANETKIL